MSKGGTIEVPEEGMKLVTIVGYVEGNPIWREMGRLVVNRNGNPQVLIERTFNPAGPVIDDSSHYLSCAVKNFSQEELDRKFLRNKTKQQHKQTPKHSPNFNDMDDDIPF